MYFSNIANEEVQYFHKTIGADFSMSLTDILSSNLFNVEEIIVDSLYRVQPLFYCKNIVSSNPNDKNLDNCSLILQKNEHETYLSFITDAEKPNFVLNENPLNIKKIGDNLSLDEFNAFIYILRNKEVLTGEINFEETPTVEGIYGTYIISDNNQLQNDTGFIINNKIKNNPITVTLVNPFFLNAKYTLTCTVRSLTGANVCIEEYHDYKTVDTFNIDLIENTPIALDLSNYTNDSVLDFNIKVKVSFNVPEIVNTDFSLSLTTDKKTIINGEQITLTAKLTGESNVEGYNIQFYENNELIDTNSTDENGYSNIVYMPTSTGIFNYTAKVFGLSETVSISVNKHITNITLVSDKNIAYIPTDFNISGLLSNELGVVSNAPVKLLNNNDLIDELITDSRGLFNKQITANTIMDYNLKAVFEETFDNTGSQSNILNITARKLNTILSINTNKTNIYYSEFISINGVLKDELDNTISNATVKLYENNNEIATTTTNSNGAYSFNKQYNTIGNYQLKVIYDGDETHNNITSVTKQITVNKAPVTLNINPTKSKYPVNELMEISLSTNYNPDSLRQNANKILVDNTEIIGNNAIFNLYPKPQADDKINIIYKGNNNYQSIAREISIDNVVKYIELELQTDNNSKYLNMTIFDENHSLLTNFNLKTTKIQYKQDKYITFDEDVFTDEYGQFTVSLNNLIQKGDKITVEYGSITANITY